MDGYRAVKWRLTEVFLFLSRIDNALMFGRLRVESRGDICPIISWLNYLCELMLFSKFGPSKNELFLLNEEKTHFMFCGLFSLLYVTTATTARKGYSLGIIRKCVHIND